MTAAAYNSIWTGPEVDAGVSYVRQLQEIDIINAIKNTVAIDTFEKIQQQVTALQKRVQELESSTTVSLSLYDNLSEIPEDIASDIFILRKDDGAALCYKVNDTIYQLSPITVTQTDTKLSIKAAGIIEQ
jgi:type II secretory ATPase GspE/PulE/Tfp pilus assembly ATPase PilB-like protein